MVFAGFIELQHFRSKRVIQHQLIELPYLMVQATESLREGRLFAPGTSPGGKFECHSV